MPPSPTSTVQSRRAASAAHKALVDEIQVALGSRPDVRLFKRHVGTAKLASGRWAHFSEKGQCDLYGFILGGRALEIEAKTGGGVLTRDQRAWRDICGRFGVLHIVAHSVEEAMAAVDAALSGGHQ